MQKVPLKPYIEEDAFSRFAEMAHHYSMSAPALAATILTEFSRVRKEALFEALGGIRPELKTRPVGRPAGSTKAHKDDRTTAVA